MSDYILQYTGREIDEALSKVARISGDSALDEDMSNLSETGKKVMDGSWVFPDKYEIFYDLSVPPSSTGTYDLSSYLPSDDFVYDVIFDSVVDVTATANKFYGVYISTDITPTVHLCRSRTLSTSAIGISCGCAILPVGPGRTVTYSTSTSSNWSGKMQLFAVGYRRVGTNS